jgi:hypothetical protein
MPRSVVCVQCIYWYLPVRWGTLSCEDNEMIMIELEHVRFCMHEATNDSACCLHLGGIPQRLQQRGPTLGSMGPCKAVFQLRITSSTGLACCITIAGASSP